MSRVTKAVFFDWDDTLNVHNRYKGLGEEAALRAIEAHLAGRGITIDTELVRRAYKGTEEEMFFKMKFDRLLIWKATLRRLRLKLDDASIREVVERYWEAIEANSRLVEDAVYVMKELKRRGYKLGIIADYDDHIRDKRSVIERSPVGSLLDTIVLGGDDCPKTKPDPSIFHHACKRIGCKPSEAIMVGDSLNDYVGAKKAGMASVIIQQNEARTGNHSVRSLIELLKVVTKIDSH